jgi:hypothetical protein
MFDDVLSEHHDHGAPAVRHLPKRQPRETRPLRIAARVAGAFAS